MRGLIFLALWGLIQADVYLHIPRGSNNRLNEHSANRDNANRLFDSQNNNRGGYNVGDKTDKSSNNEDDQYRMKYFQSGDQGESILRVEWTNQHGCGGNEDSDPHQQNCNVVLQYMCQPNEDSSTGTKAQDLLRNGKQRNTQNYNQPNKLTENENQINTRRNNAVNVQRGYHEPWAWYDNCYLRERNQGLFTADQKLRQNKLGYGSAIYTRQNPNGNRRGYECPEERDYYPYWHPTPWKDAAILPENATLCGHYTSKSFNTQPYHECVEHHDAQKNVRKHFSRWNNLKDCQENGGTWTLLHNYLEKARNKNEGQCNSAGSRYMWAVPYDSPNGRTPECLVKLSAPDCQEAPWSRTNHLGNGRDGKASNYDWKLPYFPSGETQRCVFRIRYNISTDDYDPFNTNSSHNDNPGKYILSPIQQNPYVQVGDTDSPLRLAVNTAQFGRTFQDRSHVFLLEKRPPGVTNERIMNLNVRGKRGNIVQVYPAVEYDFAPNNLELNQNDLVHIQWTGSNTHDNDNPAGDGQAGDAGEGKGGTDRNNLVEVNDRNMNYPLPFERTSLWQSATIKWIYHGKTDVKPIDLAIDMASAGYYRCVEQSNCPNFANYIAEKKTPMNELLNDAPASYEGALLQLKAGTYHFICSRNNNFSNRSQKGSIVVK